MPRPFLIRVHLSGKLRLGPLPLRLALNRLANMLQHSHLYLMNDVGRLDLRRSALARHTSTPELTQLEQSEMAGILGLQRAYQDLKPRKRA